MVGISIMKELIWKTIDFLSFSGGVEIEHWIKMGYSEDVNILKKIDIYLRINKAYVIFLKSFTNFPYSQIATR